MIRILLLVTALVIPSASRADDPALHEIPNPEGERQLQLMEEAARQLGIEITPGTEPYGAGVTIRDLDDSDPEMRERTIAYFHAMPCRDATSNYQCQRAVQIIRDGGDRLARYLIRQVEANESEVNAAGQPYIEQGEYVRLVGMTQTSTAYEYLRNRAFHLADQWEASGGRPMEERTMLHNRLIWAIESLGDTAAQPVADDAVALLGRFETDREVRARVVEMIETLHTKHGPQPQTVEALENLKRRLPPPDPEGEDDDGGGPHGGIDRALTARPR